MSTPSKSPPNDPVLEITTSILTEAAQCPWLAALLMRRRPEWLARLARLAQRVRDLPRHTRRTLRRKLASGLAVAALLLALAGTPTAYAGTIMVDEATCTLANAITSANTGVDTGGCTGASPGAAADTITLTVDVGLTAALPDINSEITIEGNGHAISRTSGSLRILSVASGGNLTLNAATISGGNAASGGGIYNAGTLSVNNSTISGNTANSMYGGANGGGIFNNGTLTVSNSTLSGNMAYRDGGGIYNSNTLTVTNSTLSGNIASSGGGIASATNGGNTTVTDSTLSGNAAINSIEGAANGGGIVNYDGSLLVQNSTISGNTAQASAGVGRGGGISNYSGTLTVTTSTIANNYAYSSSTTSEGGGIHGTATIDSSIVADNRLGPVVYNDCASYLSSGGYNIESGASCNFVGTGDQQNVDTASLNLQPLANNGVNPHPDTRALGTGSAAIDQIPDGVNSCAAGVSTDERGAVRADGVNRGGATCDVGAYEVSDQTPTAITLRDLTATAPASPGAIGIIGAALAALGAVVFGRRKATNRHRING